MQPVGELSNSDLIREFVAGMKARRLSQTKAAELVDVAQATVSEWTREVYRDIIADTRAALELVVSDMREGRALRPATSEVEKVAKVRESPRTPYADAVGDRLDGIDRLPIEERLKILKIAEVGAAYRSAAIYEAEVAARVRAEALREAERAGIVRSEAMGKESESAHARTLQLPTAAPEITESEEETFQRLLAAAAKLPADVRAKLAQQVDDIQRRAG